MEEATSCSHLFFALSSAAMKTSRLPIAIQQAVMRRLREKLGPSAALLETVRGVGYRCVNPA